MPAAPVEPAPARAVPSVPAPSTPQPLPWEGFPARSISAASPQLLFTPSAPELEYVPAPTDWSARRQRILEELLSEVVMRTDWFGSVEIAELLRKQADRERLVPLPELELGLPSSVELPLFAAGLKEQAPSSSSGVEERARGRNFWFNVNAELIIYGATEPGATVTIGGRPIRLRPDGTFSYRFSLPDGQYKLPASAISNDGDTRRAELQFSRETEYRGEVGAHRQDPALKIPAPENTL
jgi:hypothetical protein